MMIVASVTKVSVTEVKKEGDTIIYQPSSRMLALAYRPHSKGPPTYLM